MAIEITYSNNREDAVFCDICAKSCSVHKYQKNNPNSLSDLYKHINEFAVLQGSWGFFSDNKDSMEHECIMCESCYDKVIEFIKGIGGKPRGKDYLISGEDFYV